MKTLYSTYITLSIIGGMVLFALGEDLNMISESWLMWLAFIPFFLFAYGLIGHIIESQIHQLNAFWKLVFPILMGALFCLLLVIHIFFLEPLLCPCLNP